MSHPLRTCDEVQRLILNRPRPQHSLRFEACYPTVVHTSKPWLRRVRIRRRGTRLASSFPVRPRGGPYRRLRSRSGSARSHRGRPCDAPFPDAIAAKGEALIRWDRALTKLSQGDIDVVLSRRCGRGTRLPTGDRPWGRKPGSTPEPCASEELRTDPRANTNPA